jgi:hypothetical protein
MENGGGGFEEADVDGFGAFGAGLKVVFHDVAFVEGAVALAADGGLMDENVLTGLAADETEAFGVVEPLDLPLRVCHGRTP